MHLVEIIDGPHVHRYALGMHRLHKTTVHNQDSVPPYRHLGTGRTAAAPLDPPARQLPALNGFFLHKYASNCGIAPRLTNGGGRTSSAHKK